MNIRNVRRRALSLAAVAALVGTAPLALADGTTSAIRGKVVAGSQSVAGATVVVEDTRTGASRTYTTNDVGTFLASNLPVGGPYKVTVNGGRSVIVDSVSLGDIYNLTVRTEGEMEEVIVYGESLDMVDVAAGPSATFNEQDLRDAPSFSKDIAEVYSIDPRINLDNEDDGFEINCGGKHPRFNSVTLDGVGLNDLFGLNSNGYSTATGMPFPFDAVRQVSVELAPFDVTYGGFSACNINSVTKSGSNEFEGNVFYEHTSDSLRGDEIEDTTISTPSYNQKKMGFSVGGPIIKDKLFFFGAYEESDSPRFLARGPAGSGIGEVRDWLSQAEYDRIVAIANNVYNYDPGGNPGDGSQEDEKYMVRLDWLINDNHSAALIYNYYDGFQDRDSDGDSNEFEFANHFYVKSAEQETYTIKFNSQWTDNLSTSMFYSTGEMIDGQNTVGPLDFGDHQISVGRNTVYLGADDSRQANNLSYDADYTRISAEYLWNDHVITAGFEQVSLDIFNQFVQHSRGGEWDYYGASNRDGDGNPAPALCDTLTAQERFDNLACDLSGIDQFELGRPSRIYYGSGGGTNDPADASALFDYDINTLFLQDEIYFADYGLTVVAGLRYDWFDMNDAPVFNQAFTTRYNGLRNDANLDGIDILMPRIGFSWDVASDLSLRGGLGLYSGGNPNVWISNAWSNDGLTNVQVQYRNSRSLSDSILNGDVPLSGQGRIGYDVPQSLVDQVAATTADDASVSNLVLIDPGYEQPSELKFALGATYDLPADVQMDVDYLYTKQYDPAIYVDVSQEVVGFTTAGQPIYDYIDGGSRDNYMLTNSGKGGEAHLFSLVFNKGFELSDMGTLDLMGGYAWTDAEDVSAMTSSVAFSNFTSVATNDINNPLPATSEYQVEHRFTFRAVFASEIFGGLMTRASLYGYAQAGQPATYAMDSDGSLEGSSSPRRNLLYVPTGANDPNVVFANGFDQAAFFDFVAREGLNPGFQARNGAQAKWTRRVDLRIDQELPTFIDGTSGHLFVKIYNLGNLLSSDWGEVNDSQFFPVDVVSVDVNDQGQYIFESFSDRGVTDLREQRSLWEARVGVEFRF